MAPKSQAIFPPFLGINEIRRTWIPILTSRVITKTVSQTSNFKEKQKRGEPYCIFTLTADANPNNSRKLSVCGGVARIFTGSVLMTLCFLHLRIFMEPMMQKLLVERYSLNNWSLFSVCAPVEIMRAIRSSGIASVVCQF